MNTDLWIQMALFTAPALVTALFALAVLNKFIRHQEDKAKWQLMYENRKQSLPIRLQAYERMALFLERIQPAKLLVRVAPIQTEAEGYVNLLIRNIDQEFEHNLAQQIYLSADAWLLVLQAKNAVIQQLRNAGVQLQADKADVLREALIKESLQWDNPTHIALDALKIEVQSFIG